ncbi:MAG: hypothetical protein JSR91_00355 [Proteobacteria bacterium]|nr:hypothetical protein [Pseudomonadota bacterium]
MSEEVVHSIKGFDKDFKCRGFAYEIGKTYEHDGDVVVCESGFHAIGGHPLEVLRYYPPNKSRYARTTQGGALAPHTEDSKIASARITIDAEIKLPELIQAAVKWVFDRAKWKEGPVASFKNEGVTASGDYGAATASGYYGAATASGNYGAATASGRDGRAKGADGCALFLVERDSDWKIVNAWAGIVGRDGIKPSTWYRLKNGKPLEVE